MFALSQGISFASGVVVSAAVLITYHAIGHQLTVSKVFTTLLYCQMIQNVGLLYMPRGIQTAGQVFRSLGRIEVGSLTVH